MNTLYFLFSVSDQLIKRRQQNIVAEILKMLNNYGLDQKLCHDLVNTNNMFLSSSSAPLFESFLTH
jgi:hypothetical protein